MVTFYAYIFCWLICFLVVPHCQFPYMKVVFKQIAMNVNHIFRMFRTSALLSNSRLLEKCRSNV